MEITAPAILNASRATFFSGGSPVRELISCRIERQTLGPIAGTEIKDKCATVQGIYIVVYR